MVQSMASSGASRELCRREELTGVQDREDAALPHACVLELPRWVLELMVSLRSLRDDSASGRHGRRRRQGVLTSTSFRDPS